MDAPTGGGALILALIVFIGIFLVLREFFCWYFKINKRIDLEQANNNLLKKMLETQSNIDSRKDAERNERIRSDQTAD
jgi:Flp pilus assembly protein TadB